MRSGTRVNNYRIYETIKNLQTLQEEMESLPENLDLDMYRDHLRWPTDPPKSPLEK